MPNQEEDKKLKKLRALEKRGRAIRNKLDEIQNKWNDEKEKLESKGESVDYDFSDAMC